MLKPKPILDKGEAKAENHFHFAYMAELAQKWGNGSKADSLYAKATAACQNASQQRELADLMRKAGVANSLAQAAQGHGGKGTYW